MKYIINPYSKAEHTYKIIVGFSHLSSTRIGSFIGWGRNVSRYFGGIINCGCRVILCKLK